MSRGNHDVYILNIEPRMGAQNNICMFVLRQFASDTAVLIVDTLAAAEWCCSMLPVLGRSVCC